MQEQFKESVIEVLSLENGAQKTAVLDTASKLEKVGVELMRDTADNAGKAAITSNLQKVYGRLGTLELQPPLTDTEKGMLAGKYAVFTSMTEMFSVNTAKVKPQPTDTKALQTDKPKK